MIRELGDGELRQATQPERALAPPSASMRAEESKAVIMPENTVQPKDSAAQKRDLAAPSYKTRVVKRGETLSDLIREVYHTSPNPTLESSLIDLVRQHNPAILDPNLILTGSVIRFPELPKEQ